MNLILLLESDFIAPNRVRLDDRRLLHVQDVLKAAIGQKLTVGKINGLMGQGEVVNISKDALDLEISLTEKPPEALPLTLILALPRPPMLKRILFSASMLGIKKIFILNFNRVEKSLWNSSALAADAIQEQLVLGLEQAKDTVMPEVSLKKRFKPFVEDELPGLIKGKLALVAHPGKNGDSHHLINGGCPHFLVIGPEGGILDYEIGLLKTVGVQILDLGPRLLRTDSVLPYVVGAIFTDCYQHFKSRHFSD